MNTFPYGTNLPVVSIVPEVKENLSETNALIVHAPAGAGKSTLLPLALLNEPWLAGKKILMLEPRRLAARSIATRMAALLGEKVGETVGYRIRFENRVGKNTRIEVLTEGILTRMLQSDNALEEAGLVIFDEFHERSLFADVALALCRESQQVLRPDLRLIIMSATLDMPSLTDLLHAPVAQSLGRQFPVEIVWGDGADLTLLPELMAQTVVKATTEHPGDTLVFLPGEAEIRACETILKSRLQTFAILPLYGQLPQRQQQHALLPNREGKRKIVLATSIAETSLTIEGISIVVDCGFSRTAKFNPRSGLSRLETIQITQDAAAQRAGRAGRLGPGVCYRLWSKATHERLQPHRIPEIMEADLTALVLEMAHWGVNDIAQLTWLTPPPRGPLAQAGELLESLEATSSGRITAHGKKIHKLPCHPRIAHMLLMAEQEGSLALATDLAAILEERDPLPRDTGIDINLRLEALRNQRASNRLQRGFSRIEKIAQSYRNVFKASTDDGPVDPYETGLLLCAAFPERIAFARPGNNAQFQMANGSIAMAGHRDDLAHEAWLAIANVNARDGMGKIFLAAPLNPIDLQPMVKTVEHIEWDNRKGGLVAAQELRIGSIILQSKPLPNPDEARCITAILEAVRKEGERLLNWNEETKQWQNRVSGLRQWDSNHQWPETATPFLIKQADQWLSPYLTKIRKAEELKRLDLKQILHNHLDWELQGQLDKLAPERIGVPSGSSIKVDYQPNGAPPVLGVRLQEVFGLEDTPTVNNGKTPMLLHLLSPGFKPVQVTSDLRSFWANAYFEVRKELRRRYPKHAWPDNPLEAEPLRGAKRRLPQK